MPINIYSVVSENWFKRSLVQRLVRSSTDQKDRALILSGDCSLINVSMGDVYLPSYWYRDFCWMGGLELPRLCLLLRHISNENWLRRFGSRQRYKFLNSNLFLNFIRQVKEILKKLRLALESYICARNRFFIRPGWRVGTEILQR